MKKNCFLILVFFITYQLHAQIVFEDHRSEIYNYLYRMAQKGLISFEDHIRPLPRKQIIQALDSLEKQTQTLTVLERKELQFYQKEYSDLKAPVQSNTDLRILRKDGYGRLRGMSVRNQQQLLNVDPVFIAGVIGGNGRNVKRSGTGLNVWGQSGKWGYQLFYEDINESGTGIDSLRAFTPEIGIIRRDTSNKKSQNFMQVRGAISYGWKNGSVSIGNDRLLWGYGENGRVILSDKAPSYPYLRLDYRPFSWLSFNYAHAWLNSKLIDSNRTYGTGNTVFGGERKVFIPKFFVTHSILVRPIKGLDLAVGESIVYSDRLDAGYFVPVVFFKMYEINANNSSILSGSNGQIFFQASSRNHIPGTHIYGTFFIDEMRISTFFNRAKRRNQSGYTVGISKTDLLLPYLTATFEYSRITPFTYRNLIPAQDYTHHGYSLGDWMGNNADRLLFSLKYTPIPRLKTFVRYQQVRKGGAGTLEQQYFQEPQPSFLFNHQFTQKEWFTGISYEWINNLTLYANFRSLRTHIIADNSSKNDKILSAGFTFGF